MVIGLHPPVIVGADGTIEVTVAGGTGPYTFTLTDVGTGGTTVLSGSSPQMFSNLSAANYSVEVEDNGGCTETATDAVVASTTPCCDISITNVESTNEVCPGADDGTITVTATCTTCTTIEYAIAEINGGAYQASNTFTGLPDGSYTVNVRDTGDNGCNDTGSGTVAAGTDTTDPVAVCPTTGLTVNVDADECHHTGTFEATATDNCGVASFAYSIGETTITYPYDFPAGTTSVLAVVTDDNGLTANCSFDVVVTDNINPMITCPTDVTVMTSDFGDFTLVGGTQFYPLTSDLSDTNGVGGDVFINNGATFTQDATDGICFMDATSNSFFVNAANVTGSDFRFSFDVRPELLTAPSSGDLSTFFSGGNFSRWLQIGANTSNGIIGISINNGSQVFLSSETIDLGEWHNFEARYVGTTFTLSLNGTVIINETLTFNTSISSDPTFLTRSNSNGSRLVGCIRNISINGEAQQVTTGGNLCEVAVELTATATDNCAVTSLTNDGLEAYPAGTTTVTFTAMDAAGLSSTCSTMVTVIDDTDPVITCPTEGLAVNVDADECDHTGTFEATATDNCGVASRL